MTYMKYRDAELYHSKSRADSKIISIETALPRETEKAYLVDSGEVNWKGRAIGQWVPKSLSEYDKSEGTLQVEEWFALQEGLI